MVSAYILTMIIMCKTMILALLLLPWLFFLLVATNTPHFMYCYALHDTKTMLSVFKDGNISGQHPASDNSD